MQAQFIATVALITADPAASRRLHVDALGLPVRAEEDGYTFHEWQKGVVDGHLDAEHPPQVGTQCFTTRRIGSVNRATISEITKFDAPRAWTVKCIDGPVRAQVYVTVEPLGAHRSRVSIAIDFQGHGISRIVVPLFVVLEARREMPDNLAKLGQRMLASADG